MNLSIPASNPRAAGRDRIHGGGLRIGRRNALRAWILPLACLLCLPAAAARAVPFGSIANWQAFPNQTIALGDKDFVWLADSGNWNSTEKVNLGVFPAVNAESFGIDSLEGYPGPNTLWVSYRVDITSTDVFSAVSIDQDILLPGVTTTKDIFGSLADLQANPGIGNGTVTTLSITDFVPAPPPPVPLPPVQSLWVRDTIVLSSTGSVQSISNTFFQAVPEPTAWVLAAAGVGVAAACGRRRGNRPGGAGMLSRRPA